MKINKLSFAQDLLIFLQFISLAVVLVGFESYVSFGVNSCFGLCFASALFSFSVRFGL